MFDEKIVSYAGELPVPEAILKTWYEEKVSSAKISYQNSINTLIWYESMDECNDDMDTIVGIQLTDLSYGIDRKATAELDTTDVDDDTIVMWVTGDIDWDSYSDENWHV